MKSSIFLIGAVLITLPAIGAALYGLFSGRMWIFYAALASFSFNLIPFAAAHFLTKGNDDAHDVSH